MEDFSAVNWYAVVAGTIISFLFGWVWYNPTPFGTKWAEGSGVALWSADKMPVVAMVTQLLALSFLALVVGVTATSDSMFTAILAILAAATFVTSAGAFVNKSQYALTVEFMYVFCTGVVMILCQGIFRSTGSG